MIYPQKTSHPGDKLYQSLGNCRAVIARLNTPPDVLLDIVTEKFNPMGKMPFTTPVSEEAVQKQ